MNKSAHKAFTLIELLMVVAILGVLATIPILALWGGTAKARDAERRSDLKQYQVAFETFANSNSNYYPSRNAGAGQPPSVFCSDLGLSNCPDDPQGSISYRYQTDGSGSGAADATSYVLWAQLEYPKTPTTWIVVCSSGQSGEATSGIPPSGGACPL